MKLLIVCTEGYWEMKIDCGIFVYLDNTVDTG